MTLPHNETSNSHDLVISTPYDTKIAIWFISSFGLTANIFVIFVVANYTPMQKTLTNTFIANQSTIDALAAFFLLITTVFEDDHSIRVPGNLKDELTCRLWFTKFPLWGFLLASTYGIVAMSLEKYVAVVHAVWYISRFARNRAMTWTLLAAPWITGSCILGGYSITTSRITPTGYCTTYSVWPNESTQRAIGFVIFTVQYFLPFTILVYLYTRMAFRLHKRVLPSGDVPENGGTTGVTPWRNATMVRARSNVIKTLATVSLFFVLCWSSNQIYYVLYNLGFLSVDFRGTFYGVTVIMVFFNCCVNPVIYGVRYRQFQKGVMHLFGRRRRGGIPQTATIQSVNGNNEQGMNNFGNRNASDESTKRAEEKSPSRRARTCF